MPTTNRVHISIFADVARSQFHSLCIAITQFVVLFQREQRGRFGGDPPSKWTIKKLLNIFLDHGIEETVADVVTSIHIKPSVSTNGCQ